MDEPRAYIGYTEWSKSETEKQISHINTSLLLGRKAMTNLDSILKSRDITLPAKIHIAKAMVFQ